MRLFCYAIVASALFINVAPASAQFCPDGDSYSNSSDIEDYFCQHISRFNRERLPGIVILEDDDGCNDNDPTWLPSPPFPAVVTIGEWGISVRRMDYRQESRIHDMTLRHLSDDNLEYFSNGRRIVDRLSDDLEDDLWSEMEDLPPGVFRSIERGNLVYFHVPIDSRF